MIIHYHRKIDFNFLVGNTNIDSAIENTVSSLWTIYLLCYPIFKPGTLKGIFFPWYHFCWILWLSVHHSEFPLRVSFSSFLKIFISTLTQTIESDTRMWRQTVFNSFTCAEPNFVLSRMIFFGYCNFFKGLNQSFSTLKR